MAKKQSSVPTRLRPEEKERFRQIDAETASGRRRTSSIDDLAWVYNHLDNEDVTAMDAPSRGAWTRLFHARFNRVNFFNSTWPTALKEIVKRKVPAVPQGPGRAIQKSHDEIRAMLIAAVEESKTMEI